MPLPQPPYSYRSDPAVPPAPATGVFTVMDAHCALCARGASWIARHDHGQLFSIVPLQSELGQALMRHYGLDPQDPASWLYVEDGIAYASLDAVIRVGRKLGGIWRLAASLLFLPRPLRDGLYRAVARNRYRIFGRADLCALPDPEVRKRLWPAPLAVWPRQGQS